jgi:hypothetical protein
MGWWHDRELRHAMYKAVAVASLLSLLVALALVWVVYARAGRPRPSRDEHRQKQRWQQMGPRVVSTSPAESGIDERRST